MTEWSWENDHRRLDCLHIDGRELRAGDRVRLYPRGGGDAFDLFLQGKLATIASIEQDFEGRAHLAVTVDDDPGCDLGLARQTGHRFFFAPDEIEPCAPSRGDTP